MKWTDKLENLFKRRRREPQIDNIDTDNHFDSDVTTPAIPINFSLRILVISDTHGCFAEDMIPVNSQGDVQADICLLLGDMSDRDVAIVDEFINIPKYGILGNHDGWDLYDRHGIENIHGKVIDFNGVRIAGLQGSIKYKYSDMPLYTDDESVEIADGMDSADILISHDSPKYLHGDRDFAHSGLRGITHFCEKWNVPLNIHGHHHVDLHNVLPNGTTSVGCYMSNIVEATPHYVQSINYE